MRKNLFLLVLLVALAAIPGYAAVITTVDFETTTNGADSGNGPGFSTPLATLGISLTGDGLSSDIFIGLATYGAPPPAIAGQTAFITSASGGSRTATITFLDATKPIGSSISLDLWDTNSSPAQRVIVRAYDTGGNLVETLFLSPEAATLTFTTGLRISRIELFDNGADGFVFDNLVYGRETGGGGGAIPEPSTFALLGSALLGFGLLRRRNS